MPAPIGSGFNVKPSVAATTINTPQQQTLQAKASIAQVAPSPVVPVVPEVKAPTPSPERIEMNKRFNALVEKERASSQRAMQASTASKAQATKIAELEAKLATLQPADVVKSTYQNDLKARALQNPIEAMKDLGMTYEQLTQFVLNDSKPTPELVESRMQRELQQLRDENSRRDSEFKAQQAQAAEQANAQAQQQYQQATDQVKLEIEDFVKARPDDFALVSKNEASGVVFELMSQHYNNTGRIMNVEEACKSVESYFEEQALDLFKVAKLQAKLGINAPLATNTGTQGTGIPPVAGNEAAPITKPKWVPTTLTHQIATDGTARPVKENLSPAERKAKVLAKLYGRG